MSIEAIKKALEGATPDRVERLWWFLHILSKSSGSTNADDDKWNWINAFCSDSEDDTFNRAEKLGFIRVSHDSFMETSKAGMTPAGFSFINYFEKAPSFSLISEIDRLHRENALMQERTADYPTISAKLHDREKAREAEQRDCREAIARAEAAEAEVKRLEQAIKNMTGNKIGFTYEPTGERVTLYAPNPNAFEIIAKHPEILSVVVSTRKEIERRTALASTGGEHHAGK